jgi:hypothetical protein
MEAKKTYKRRTREEVAAWLQRARERKQAWEEQTQLELKAMAEEARRAKESHYFDFAG